MDPPSEFNLEFDFSHQNEWIHFFNDQHDWSDWINESMTKTTWLIWSNWWLNHINMKVFLLQNLMPNVFTFIQLCSKMYRLLRNWWTNLQINLIAPIQLMIKSTWLCFFFKIWCLIFPLLYNFTLKCIVCPKQLTNRYIIVKCVKYYCTVYPFSVYNAWGEHYWTKPTLPIVLGPTLLLQNNRRRNTYITVIKHKQTDRHFLFTSPSHPLPLSLFTS